MKKIIIPLFAALLTLSATAQEESSSESEAPVPSLVDYEAFVDLVKEVDAHRKARIVSIKQFNDMSKEEDVIILDTRSKAMYEAKHVKGAIHLNFADFTQETLSLLIPDPTTRILIYCNNNFDDDEIYFATKAYVPPKFESGGKELTLALNIPTYINLYGYGYKNVYELGELISVFDGRIEFEGSSVGESPLQGGLKIKN